MKTNDRYLDKDGQWQAVEAPEPEVVLIVEEPEPKIEIRRADVGRLFRILINYDFARWRRLDEAGQWHKYFDQWLPKGRIANTGSCLTCAQLYPERRHQVGGTRYCGNHIRYYGSKPQIVRKCLGCGDEVLLKELYGWRHG